MRKLRFAMLLAALVGLALAATSTQAAFHQWSIAEVFSNVDGSVQFIELVSAGPAETVANNAEIRTTFANPDKVFDFPGDLIGNTLNKRLLIATPGFASLPGAVTPDFTLPSTNFFNAAGDTIRLFQPTFGEFHSRTFTSVPTDGVMSRNYPPAAGTLLTNSPTNYAGNMGPVNLAPPVTTGDYNGDLTVNAADYTFWRDTLGQTGLPLGSGADGDADGMIDDGDYDFWKLHFGEVLGGAGSGVIVPEPATLGLLLIGLIAQWIFAAARWRRNA
jgi:hypothetical protein